MHLHPRLSSTLRAGIFLLALTLSVTFIFHSKASAACTVPSANFGSATMTLSVPSAATYRIWTRMEAASATANSFMMEVDGGSCYVVGGNGLSGSAWTWVDYQNGSSTSKIQQSLSQGSHTIRLFGTQAGVKVDRIIATSDLGCVPDDPSGSKCNNPGDTTVPTVSLTSPAANATVGGTANIAATAADNTAVAKVEFYANSALLNTDTTAPYSYAWDTSLQANGSYTILAKAYDAAGNTASDTRSVSIKNSDGQGPSTPTGVTATVVSYNKVNVSWAASHDNVAVTGYVVTRNGSPIAHLGSVTTYADATVSANVTYSYTVTALDAAGNASAASAAVKVTTSNPTDTQAPTKPTKLQTQAISPSQINLKWVASTDNIGVAGYQIFRQSGAGPTQKIATVTTNTFGDTTLKQHTTYTYSVKAVDAAGNVSAVSNYDTITTHTKQKSSELIGYIKDANKHPIPYAKVTFPIDGKNHTYVANSQGWYDVDNVPGGSYIMVFSANGYHSTTISRNVNSGARVAQHATLQKL